MKTDSHPGVQRGIAERFKWYQEVAERRGEQLRQSDIQIARLRAALEEISLGGNGRAGLIADRVLHEQWGD